MEQDIRRSVCNIAEHYGGLRDDDSCTYIKLVYLYSTQSAAPERSAESLQLIPDILAEYGISGQYTYINVTDRQNRLNLNILFEYMDDHEDDVVLLVNALGSELLYDVAAFLRQEEYTNYLILNSASTLDDVVLDDPRVVRIVPRDGVNALFFKELIVRVPADNRVLIVDENDKWAEQLASYIQEVTPNMIRYDIADLLDGTTSLPLGTMTIVTLADPSIPAMMKILPSRSNDVKLLLLGESDAGISPASIEELQLFRQWNTKIIVPRINTSTTVSTFVKRTGWTSISNTLGGVVSILQLAAYLKYALSTDRRALKDRSDEVNALYLLPTIRNYYMGIGLDEESMDALTGIYTALYFSRVNSPATAVDTVGVSLLDSDGTIKMYVGNQIE